MKKTASPTKNFDDNWLSASAEAALQTLTQAGADAEALIDAWLQRGNAAAISAAAEQSSGPARKAARRAVNVLKARGVTIPERRRVAQVAGAKAEEQLEAWMLPPDGSGNLLFAVGARSRASRYRAAFVFINDALGVQRIESTELSQSQLKETFQKLVGAAEFKPVKVPVEWARFRIAAARRRHQERGAPLPLGFASASSLLEPLPEAAPPHPFDEEGLELADDDARELAQNSVSLHSLPEFRSWLPPKAAVDEMLLKVGETLTPGEQPPPDELNRRLGEAINAATDRFFSAPERRADLVRVMKDSALSVLAREGEVRALDCVAAMKRIESAGLITDAPHEIGFLRGFFEKAVSYLIAQGQGNLRIPIPMRPEANAPNEATAAGAELAETVQAVSEGGATPGAASSEQPAAPGGETSAEPSQG